MSYLEAAHEVLESEGNPLSYREITRLAIERRLIEPGGPTPEASLNAALSVDLARRGAGSRFVRIKPGVVGLRKWSSKATPEIVEVIGPSDRRVRVPLFPTYSEVRLILPIWNGRQRHQILGLAAAIRDLWGNPQDPVDWTRPDEWIPARLQGENRDLAATIWEDSGKRVNPRYTSGQWLLANTYRLIERSGADLIVVTPLGQDFIEHERGKTVALIDEGEGLLKLLAIVADKGPGRRGDFLPDWEDYLRRRSNFGTESTVRDTFSRRIQNLVERGLLSRNGTTYAITDLGLNRLRDLGGDEAIESTEEQQEIRELVKKHQLGVRSKLQALLDSMDPYAFEHLVKQLLEAMDYQNVKVTPLSGDKGVDVIADIELGITSVREVVQVKRHKKSVQRKDLDALRGSLHRFDAVRGTIITTNDFAKGTRESAIERGAAPITLINGEKLIELLVQHGVGVRKRNIELLEVDTDAFVGELDDSGEKLPT